jgi:NAD(P)-dependent dehydrogenase (short-subunit alcohol dehydrogenase family)
MGVYVVSGCAWGTGHAVARRLRAQGHDVIGIDTHDADVVADLTTADGRAHAVAEVLDRSRHRLDGAVLATRPDTGAMSANPQDLDERLVRHAYHAVVDLLTAWRPAMAAVHRAKAVVCTGTAVASTAVPESVIRALMADNLRAVLDYTRQFGPRGQALALAAAKIAVTRWVAREGVAPEWASKGIRLNAMSTPATAPATARSPRLVGGGLAERLRTTEATPADTTAEWVHLMLSPMADSLYGGIVAPGAPSRLAGASRNWATIGADASWEMDDAWWSADAWEADDATTHAAASVGAEFRWPVAPLGR